MRAAHLLALVLAAGAGSCAPGSDVDRPFNEVPEADDDTADESEAWPPLEVVPGSDSDPQEGVFDPGRVHEVVIELSDEAVQSLRTTPETWVEGRVEFDGLVGDPVGVRLKGSASFQSVDEKPAWKIKFDHFDEGMRLFGLERLTLNNEVWDPTMMAEAMAYAAFRGNGSAAPRTGYAAVTLNERYLGAYAIIESMDDQFVDQQWPGSNGGLWEMTRDCDFTGDCSCFELQETGSNYEADALIQGCEAVATGTVAALAGAFDWDALIAFMAVEQAVNHPDSYSYNLNNFFVYHEPLGDRIFLSPWGADSTFIYAYPPSTPNPDCEPLHTDVDTKTPEGWLTGFCLADEVCRADLESKLLDVADWMEDSDLVARMEANRVMLDPWAELESEVNWTVEDRDARVQCFLEWTGRRPAEIREWVASGAATRCSP